MSNGTVEIGKRNLGSVGLKKIDAVTKNGIGGVEFTLKNKSTGRCFYGT